MTTWPRGGLSRHVAVAYAPDGRIYRVRSLCRSCTDRLETLRP